MLKWLKQKPLVNDTDQVHVTQHSFDNNIHNELEDNWVQENQPGPQNVQTSVSKGTGNANLLEKNGLDFLSENVTDDPLAIFQLQMNVPNYTSPTKKLRLFKSPKTSRKSREAGKGNEIYAVSR